MNGVVIINTNTLKNCVTELDTAKNYYNNKKSTFSRNSFGYCTNLNNYLTKIYNIYNDISNNIGNIKNYLDDYTNDVEAFENQMSGKNGYIKATNINNEVSKYKNSIQKVVLDDNNLFQINSYSNSQSTTTFNDPYLGVKTAGANVAVCGLAFLEGIVNVAEMIGDGAATVAAGACTIFGADNAAANIGEFIKKDWSKDLYYDAVSATGLDKYADPNSTAANICSMAGTAAGMIALTVATSGAASAAFGAGSTTATVVTSVARGVTMGLSNAGSESERAMQHGATIEQAEVVGAVGGAIGLATGGISGTFDSAARAAGASMGAAGIGQICKYALASFGVGASEPLINMVAHTAVYRNDGKGTFIDSFKENAIEDNLLFSMFLAGGINAAGTAIGGLISIKDFNDNGSYSLGSRKYSSKFAKEYAKELDERLHMDAATGKQLESAFFSDDYVIGVHCSGSRQGAAISTEGLLLTGKDAGSAYYEGISQLSQNINFIKNSSEVSYLNFMHEIEASSGYKTVDGIGDAVIICIPKAEFDIKASSFVDGINYRVVSGNKEYLDPKYILGYVTNDNGTLSNFKLNDKFTGNALMANLRKLGAVAAPVLDDVTEELPGRIPKTKNLSDEEIQLKRDKYNKLLIENPELAAILENESKGNAVQIYDDLYDAYKNIKALRQEIETGMGSITSDEIPILNQRLITKVTQSMPQTATRELSDAELTIKMNRFNELLDSNYSLKKYYHGEMSDFQLDENMAKQVATLTILEKEISSGVGDVSIDEANLVSRLLTTQKANLQLKQDILRKTDSISNPYAKIRALYMELNKKLHYSSDYIVGSDDVKTRIYGQNMTFKDINESHTVVCKGWSELFQELLLDSGFTEEQVRITGGNRVLSHKWVEINLGEGGIIVADATDNIGGSIDLAAAKGGYATNGFMYLDPSWSGHSLRVSRKNNMFSPEVLKSNQDWLFELDKSLGYANEGGYAADQIQVAKKLFADVDLAAKVFPKEQLDGIIKEITSLEVPNGLDGFEAFAYYKKIFENVLDADQVKNVRYQGMYRKIDGMVEPLLVMNYGEMGRLKYFVYSKGLGKRYFADAESYMKFLDDFNIFS